MHVGAANGKNLASKITVLVDTRDHLVRYRVFESLRAEKSRIFEAKILDFTQTILGRSFTGPSSSRGMVSSRSVYERLREPELSAQSLRLAIP